MLPAGAASTGLATQRPQDTRFLDAAWDAGAACRHKRLRSAESCQQVFFRQLWAGSPRKSVYLACCVASIDCSWQSLSPQHCPPNRLLLLE